MSSSLNLLVVTGDHYVGDPEKPGGAYGPEDLRVHASMVEAISSIEGWEVEVVNRHEGLLERLRVDPPGMVVNFCDTGFFNRIELELHVPAYCELLDIPYTGSPPAAIAMCYDKAVVRLVAQSMGIAVPREIYLPAGSTTVPQELEYPILLKPNKSDGSFGITKDAVIRSAEQGRRYLAWLDENLSGRDVLAQEYLPLQEYGMGLDGILRSRDDALIGILNGVDYDEWNPETDTLIPRNYAAQDLSGKRACKRQLQKELGLKQKPNTPLIGIVSRLVEQKGFDLLEHVLPGMLEQRDFALAVLGTGQPRFEEFFTGLQHQAPGRAAFFRGYSEKMAHMIEAGSDMFLMPSRYEPCGLNQMYSLKYGTIPIVRETGGLADSVQPINPDNGTGTGVLFRHYDGTGVEWAINTALDLYEDKPLWKEVMQNGMAMDFSWQQQGAQYVTMFRQLVGK